MFPHAIVILMSNEMTITQWHVPVDDVSCYWYAIFTSVPPAAVSELLPVIGAVVVAKLNQQIISGGLEGRDL